MDVHEWHRIHDDYVAEHGEDSRPEAVAAADAEEPWEFSLAPGGRWLVADPSYIQVFHGAHGTLYSGAAARDLRPE